MGKLWTGAGYVLQRMSWMVLSLLLIRCCCSGPCILVIWIVASLTIDEVMHRIIVVLLLGFGTQGRLRPLGGIIERSSVVLQMWPMIVFLPSLVAVALWWCLC